MTLFPKLKNTDIKQSVSTFFDRFGFHGTALIVTAELIWAASILVPVLAVIGTLYNATNAWMAVLPGFLGAVTFLIVLIIGGLAATLPSVYLAKWREAFWQWIERRHPMLDEREAPITKAPFYSNGLDIQDAD